ncbi:unnamed protein product [Medioppia subpectinata]|uniref:Carrier domain-containing protein n=1 Tax=Medioppia subpectinata TaxID=1979941 RepID=A0A7R9Q3K8_9ACAR|nr:unnamed protein product [Medioppia subpectinata]CAG2111552.1 unnamed protein product [Medioppia subpectinata]
MTFELSDEFYIGSIYKTYIILIRKSDSLTDRNNLLTAVSRILGHKDLEKFDAKTCLSELEMDSLLSVETKQVIERDFELVLSTQKIQNLTIERIRQIDSSAPTASNGSEKKTSAEAAISDESPKTHDITDTSVVSADKRGRKVFYLPPTDGTYHLFVPVATRMTRPVIGLNWTEECLQFGSIRETAQHFLDVIHSEFTNQLDDGFDLCSYSYGVFVAYDMYLALQRAASSGSVSGDQPFPEAKLVALDLCPVQNRKDVVLSSAATQHIFNGDQKLSLLFSFLKDKTSIQSQELIQTVTGVERSLWERVVAELLIERIGDPCLAPNQVMFAVKTHVHKMQHMIDYTIGGNVLLIRADQPLVGVGETNRESRHTVKHDYGFSEVCPNGSERSIISNEFRSSGLNGVSGLKPESGYDIKSGYECLIISGKCIVHILDGNHKTFLADNPHHISTYICNIENYRVLAFDHFFGIILDIIATNV